MDHNLITRMDRAQPFTSQSRASPLQAIVSLEYMFANVSLVTIALFVIFGAVFGRMLRELNSAT